MSPSCFSRFQKYLAPKRRSGRQTPSPARERSPEVPVPASPSKAHPPPAGRHVFRVTGIPPKATAVDLTAALSSAFSAEKITVDERETSLCPSPDKRSQTALVQFQPHSPSRLAMLRQKDTHRIEMGTAEIAIGKDFDGLTQLYATATNEEIIADIVAVCGLNGHPYGSWARKEDEHGRRKMWLRHFLAEDLPKCRTMIYGYDSSLSKENRSIHSIPDYTDSFLEELKKARRSPEEQERPIIFIGHSFGGIIIAQSLVKAKENGDAHNDLFSRTRATIFFGTPHRGMLVEDILAMIGSHSQRTTLVKSIETGSTELKRELKRFIDYSASIELKIVNFKEIEQTRKLGKDGKWTRSGEYFTAVEEASSVLQLPVTMEESLAIEGDHSTMVKFKHKEVQAYKTVLRYLEDYISIRGPMTAYQAVMSENATDLKRALKQPHVNLNGIHRGQGTLLHMSITNNDKDSTKVLLTAGANAEIDNTDGDKPLHLAVRKGYRWAIDLLLDHGADLAARSQGLTVLHIAAKAGDQEMAEFLLSKETAEFLLNKGSNMTVVSTDVRYRLTPLQFAARGGHIGTVEVLRKKGADINGIGTDKNTALHDAVWQGHEEMVEFLLENGSDTSIAEKNGNTALHFAAFQGRKKILELLLKYGADKMAEDTSGRTALHVAAKGGYVDILELLLAKGMDHSITSTNGQTALHIAAENNNAQAVEFLLKKGADKEKLDRNGSTALQLAGHGTVVQLLQS